MSNKNKQDTAEQLDIIDGAVKKYYALPKEEQVHDELIEEAKALSEKTRKGLTEETKPSGSKYLDAIKGLEVLKDLEGDAGKRDKIQAAIEGLQVLMELS